jgi:hypothetical protein
MKPAPPVTTQSMSRRSLRGVGGEEPENACSVRVSGAQAGHWPATA